MILLNDEDADGNAVSYDEGDEDYEDDYLSQVCQRCEMRGSAGQPLRLKRNQRDPSRQQPRTARDLALPACVCVCVHATCACWKARVCGFSSFVRTTHSKRGKSEIHM